MRRTKGQMAQRNFNSGLIMDICLHPEFLDRLVRIPWFSRVFEPDEISTPLDYQYVKSWDEAKPLFRAVKWEWTTNEARNALSGHVGIKFSELFQTTWNEMVVEVNPWIDTHITPVATDMANRHNLGETFVHCVEGNMLMMIMDDIYRDTKPPVLFYPELLKFYEAGHFPCGWKKGKWPKGILMMA